RRAPSAARPRRRLERAPVSQPALLPRISPLLRPAWSRRILPARSSLPTASAPAPSAFPKRRSRCAQGGSISDRESARACSLPRSWTNRTAGPCRTPGWQAWCTHHRDSRTRSRSSGACGSTSRVVAAPFRTGLERHTEPRDCYRARQLWVVARECGEDLDRFRRFVLFYQDQSLDEAALGVLRLL